ncbi:hypothetical protein F4861DRAFT_539010 [Xylaria intraflava]|nr:hypothetical protein F4861DRAFT_539010 [Xylaria intraflava]
MKVQLGGLCGWSVDAQALRLELLQYIPPNYLPTGSSVSSSSSNITTPAPPTREIKNMIDRHARYHRIAVNLM